MTNNILKESVHADEIVQKLAESEAAKGGYSMVERRRNQSVPL